MIHHFFKTNFKRKNDVYNYLRAAFSLAEVLITLTIIGTVAALTIGVINNIQDNQFKVAYKKAYSIGIQAIKQVNVDNLFSEVPYDNDNNVYKNNFIIFMDQFRITKKCVDADISACWNPLGEKVVNAYPASNSFAFVDSSGCAWALAGTHAPWLVIDTNGFKKPNQLGKDRFAFRLTSLSDATAVIHAASSQFVNLTPFADNYSAICSGTNKCLTEQNYYGTSWLFN